MNTNNNAQYPVYISMILCMMHVSNSHTLDEVMLNVWSVIKFADTVTTYCWKDKSVTYKLYHCNLQLYLELCNVAINLYGSNLLYLYKERSAICQWYRVSKRLCHVWKIAQNMNMALFYFGTFWIQLWIITIYSLPKSANNHNHYQINCRI